MIPLWLSHFVWAIQDAIVAGAVCFPYPSSSNLKVVLHLSPSFVKSG